MLDSREFEFLKSEYEALGQQHVFAHWDELNPEQQQSLFDQLREFDFRLIQQCQHLLTDEEDASEQEVLEPVDVIRLPGSEGEAARHQAMGELGESLIRAGRVAAFVVAGGQGSRLGFDGPKGSYIIGPVTERSLFQIFAEKIQAASERYGVTIPWYIMTSHANDTQTRDFFKQHDYFGLSPDDVFFFPQRMIPAMDESGRLMMAGKGRVFVSPNGHGGSLLALKESGALEDMARRGIDMLSYFQVDNVLINPVDAVFIGYHHAAGAEMSSKMLEKCNPFEKVGAFGRVNGRLRVIEYSNLSDEEKQATLPDGRLMYGAGSIAIHLIQRDFIASLTRDGLTLPYHKAHKKIPCIDESGALVNPQVPNGYKFETFVFDALAETTSSVILEIAREDEFSPVKNAEGEDSALTAKADLTAQYARWLEAAGVAVPRDAQGRPAIAIEISPLFADSAEALKKRDLSDLQWGDALVLS